MTEEEEDAFIEQHYPKIMHDLDDALRMWIAHKFLEGGVLMYISEDDTEWVVEFWVDATVKSKKVHMRVDQLLAMTHEERVTYATVQIQLLQ